MQKSFETDLEARAIRIQKDCTTDLEAFLILVGTPMEGPFRRAPLTNRNTIRKKNMNFQKPLQKLVLCAFRSFLQPMQKGLRNRFRSMFRSLFKRGLEAYLEGFLQTILQTTKNQEAYLEERLHSDLEESYNQQEHHWKKTNNEFRRNCKSAQKQMSARRKPHLEESLEGAQKPFHNRFRKMTRMIQKVALRTFRRQFRRALRR